MTAALLGVANGTSSSTFATATRTTAAGSDLILIAARTGVTANDTFTAVTDTAGNTWTRRAFSAVGGVGRRIEIWDCLNAASVTSVTATFPGTNAAFLDLMEWSGLDAWIDADAIVRASSTTPAAIQTTPANTGDLIIAGCMANPNTAAQCAPGSGWNVVAGVHASGPACAHRADSVATTPIGPSWTLNSAAGSGLVTAAYSVTPDPPGGLTVTVWNGSVELGATLEGVWNGSTIMPATVEQVTV